MPRPAPPTEPSWYHRLSSARRRIARASDRAPRLQYVPTPDVAAAVSGLRVALLAGRAAPVARCCQEIARGVCRHFAVVPVRVTVLRRRPANHDGELHGLYEGAEHDGEHDRIRLWMLTAKRGQVVAFRTFLRTLVHEICHHLDFTTLGLVESLHTVGFLRRESSLFAVLTEADLTGGEAAPITPHRAEEAQLSLGFLADAAAPDDPGGHEGNGDELASRGQRARQRQRGAGQVLGKA